MPLVRRGGRADVVEPLPACDVPVGGDTGRRLLEIDRRIATLTAERGDLLLRLRREAAIPDVSSVTPAAPRGARDVSTTTVGLPAIGRRVVHQGAGRPRTATHRRGDRGAGGGVARRARARVPRAGPRRARQDTPRSGRLARTGGTGDGRACCCWLRLRSARLRSPCGADRRWLRWLATAAASASSWTVLADPYVELVEAYTAPPALLIIALAAAELRARPDGSSWPVLGSGLSLLTAPTFVQLVDDPGDLVRLAAVVALGSALVLAGRGWGLQSPLAIGVGALVTAALTQHGVVTDLPARWLLLATGGCLLLWLPISYERQLQRMATARRRLLALR